MASQAPLQAYTTVGPKTHAESHPTPTFLGFPTLVGFAVPQALLPTPTALPKAYREGPPALIAEVEPPVRFEPMTRPPWEVIARLQYIRHGG
jgi:hypothetical protein